MITIQRIRVRWSADGRGAPHANARRGLEVPRLLPRVGIAHEVLAEEHNGYELQENTLPLTDTGLSLRTDGEALIVDRPPGSEAYPRSSGPAHLFRLRPGEVGRYHANFRFSRSSWYYESWLIHVVHGPTHPGVFTEAAPAHIVDHRTHLYG